jgi:hypothetical protein
MAMRIVIAIIAAGLAASGVNAQNAQIQRPSAEQLRQAMEKLEWMIGDWRGSGWVESARLGRREFSYTLSVRSEFDGLVLVVSGMGFDTADLSVPYAEQLLITGPPPAVLLGPPGTYGWMELSSIGFLRGNEAQGTESSLQAGFPFTAQDCDRILDDSYRDLCLLHNGTIVWSRATISLNDEDEWVETREWQQEEGVIRTWNKYFEVVLRRMQ